MAVKHFLHFAGLFTFRPHKRAACLFPLPRLFTGPRFGLMLALPSRTLFRIRYDSQRMWPANDDNEGTDNDDAEAEADADCDDAHLGSS